MVASTSAAVSSSVSDRKRLANLRNAQKSTGPRTPDGKERASRNSTIHGFFAKDILVFGEDPDEFKAYRIAMLHRLDPRDDFEMEYAEQFISAGWKLKRLRAAERENYDGHLIRTLESLRAIPGSRVSGKPVELRPGAAARLLAQDLNQPRSTFTRFQSYEQRLQNMMNRAHRQIRLLQDEERPGLLSDYAGKLIRKEQGHTDDERNEPTATVTDEPATGSVADPLSIDTDATPAREEKPARDPAGNDPPEESDV